MLTYGGVDAYGCHHNRKAGGYHCHRGQFVRQSFGSKEEMLQKLKGAEGVNDGAKQRETPRK